MERIKISCSYNSTLKILRSIKILKKQKTSTIREKFAKDTAFEFQSIKSLSQQLGLMLLKGYLKAVKKGLKKPKSKSIYLL